MRLTTKPMKFSTPATGFFKSKVSIFNGGVSGGGYFFKVLKSKKLK